MPDRIVVRGAREHNLEGVDLSIPRDALVTFTGVSGSGKSSLAYSTIFQEGQRRFLESRSSYARQFLGRMVGTLTDVLDFLRRFLARLGTPAASNAAARRAVLEYDVWQLESPNLLDP